MRKVDAGLVGAHATLQDRVTTALIELYGYETSQVMVLPIAGGSTAYLGWLKENLPA